MQFSKGVEYALHSLLQMLNAPAGKSVGIKELAVFQGISETYLSKIFTKLRKTGIVKAAPGVNGGYELAVAPEKITFWDVIEAVEGSSDMFQCIEIRQNTATLDKENLPDSYTKCPCLIKTVMLDAEEQMRKHLRSKTIGWLRDEVRRKIPAEQAEAAKEWFRSKKR
ncbi:Rrf2 family transcriptional regulator [Geovibrio thiophilus]|uniref:Rrf2 family transcriptional regulator n=1 Tax=Geovibrio thiophilus TaxID=139438 RepID=A0A3R5XW81_9BACT|nr:Rrf2 family transcriptional regulator [Geovibrio thiophilus]QAR32612.1 Rrf2 family transcriptional regulator [Geovibrio thiophilus]